MEFVIGVYGIIYVLWLLSCVVAGVPKAALSVTLFFVMIPIIAVVAVFVGIVALGATPLICIFSSEAREAFRQGILNKG